MKTRFFHLAVLIAARAWSSPSPPETASYTLHATLDPREMRVVGNEVLRWKNTTTHSVDEMRFHLYMNAFKSAETTLMRGGGAAVPEDFSEWGSIRVSRIEIDGGRRLQLETIAPDDSNQHDQTVARLVLPEPLEPGAGLTLRMSFSVKLPLCLSRTGYAGDFIMLAQWYPKVGVLMPDGSWNCHQMLPFGEFFADFGDYDVTLRLPERFTIVASGTRLSRVLEGSTQVVRYRAEGVTDFAAAAQPRVPVQKSFWRRRDGSRVVLELFMQPEHLRYADRHRRAMEVSLELLEDWCAPYPYPTLTLVDPPWHAAATAGGMEYPMLFTTATPLLESSGCLDTIEGITIHETVHQYFQGILASDEVAEPWLDEGVTSYLTSKILDSRYGPSELDLRFRRMPMAWFIPLPRIASWQREKIGWLSSPDAGVATSASWEYQSDQAYYSQVYARPALFFRGLENRIGTPAIRRAFTRYYEEHAFSHPQAADLIRALSDAAGADVGGDLAALLGSARPPDLRIDDVVPGDGRNRPARILVSRHGPAPWPVVVCAWTGGERPVSLVWDTRTRQQEFKVTGPVCAVAIDPDQTVLLDRDDLNNSWEARHDRRFAWGWSEALAGVIQALLAP
ncbi:MAG: M1 family metallopeptidase [Acidobacteria bacterium]|nr:M1 family metallopeptidase [Acidobacteriota bacterium]